MVGRGNGGGRGELGKVKIFPKSESDEPLGSYHIEHRTGRTYAHIGRKLVEVYPNTQPRHRDSYVLEEPQEKPRIADLIDARIEALPEKHMGYGFVKW